MKKILIALFGNDTSRGLIPGLIKDIKESWKRRLKNFKEAIK